MASRDTSHSPEFVVELPACRAGQLRALYRLHNGLMVEVSTVPDTGPAMDGLLGVLGVLIGPGDPSAEYAVDRDPATEETMAFPCLSDGQRVDSIHIVAAQGPGSRERVLELLAAGTSWRPDVTTG